MPLTVKDQTDRRHSLLAVGNRWIRDRAPRERERWIVFAASMAVISCLAIDRFAHAHSNVLFIIAVAVTAWRTDALIRQRAEAVCRVGDLERLNHEIERRVEEVQTLASRSMLLQEATAALARARTESDVADAVLGKGVAAVHAERGFLARVEGDRVEVIHVWGYRPEVEARLLGPQTNLPLLVRAVQTRQPLWVRTADEHRTAYRSVYDHLGLTTVANASVAIPLVSGDEVVGALGLIFVDPSALGPTSESFALMLGQAAADALSRARSYDVERAARTEAERLAHARADVLGVVAHDLRNPLNLITSSTSLMLELMTPAGGRQRKMLEITQRAARQMNRLIGDLLDATRLQAGRLTLDLQNVDARTLLLDAEGSMRPAAEERQIELFTELPDETSLIRCDEGRLHQVIGNLIGNALKFTDKGGRVLLSAQPNELEVVFTVGDTGPGIPHEHVERLFDRFWQARDGDHRGVGLGLTITKGIVEAHGGRIWVESTVGVGSSFRFAIPACPAEGSVPWRMAG